MKEKLETHSDEVDSIVAAWQVQRSDFDAQPLAVFSRLLRLGRYIDRIRRTIFAQYDLETWEFEMLAALRRSGAPFQLTAGQLMNETLVSSGTITNRIMRMQDSGLIERSRDKVDRRVVYVKATPKGITQVDAAMEALLNEQRNQLADFSEQEIRQARDFLKQMIENIDNC